MQDYVNDKTICISIKGGRISAEILRKALVKVVHMLEKEHAKSVAGKKEKIPQGKQTLKDLTKQKDKLANIQVTNKNIGSFDRVARKYDIDYALKKDRSVRPPIYYVFFKAKDVDVMTAAFKEYTNRTAKKKARPSARNSPKLCRLLRTPSTSRERSTSIRSIPDENVEEKASA